MVRDWEQLLHVLEDIERERVIDRLTSIDEADEDLYCGHQSYWKTYDCAVNLRNESH